VAQRRLLRLQLRPQERVLQTFSAKSRFFYAPRAYVTSTRFDFYNEGSRTSQYQINQNGFGFDGGYT
jgi:hypothetical protein